MSGKQTQKKATRETKIDDFPVEELEKAKKFIQNGQAEGDVNNEIKEHRIQDTMSECLKGKRHAERQIKGGGSVQYSCIKSKAELETNIDGSIGIKALILD